MLFRVGAGAGAGVVVAAAAHTRGLHARDPALAPPAAPPALAGALSPAHHARKQRMLAHSSLELMSFCARSGEFAARLDVLQQVPAQRAARRVCHRGGRARRFCTHPFYLHRSHRHHPRYDDDGPLDDDDALDPVVVVDDDDYNDYPLV
eukprot:835201-Rhodomonas_salina.1